MNRRDFFAIGFIPILTKLKPHQYSGNDSSVITGNYWEGENIPIIPPKYSSTRTFSIKPDGYCLTEIETQYDWGFITETFDPPILWGHELDRSKVNIRYGNK